VTDDSLIRIFDVKTGEIKTGELKTIPLA